MRERRQLGHDVSAGAGRAGRRRAGDPRLARRRTGGALVLRGAVRRPRRGDSGLGLWAADRGGDRGFPKSSAKRP